MIKTCENCGADKSERICTDCGMDVSNGPEPMYVLTRWEPKGDYHAKQMATIEMFMDDLTTVNRMELLSLINRAEGEGERKAKEKMKVKVLEAIDLCPIDLVEEGMTMGGDSKKIVHAVRVDDLKSAIGEIWEG